MRRLFGSLSAAFLSVATGYGAETQSPRFGPSGATFAWIPPGTFQMGCVPQDEPCLTWEQPRHAVTLTKGFWMMTTEVTVGQYRKFAGATDKSMPPAPEFPQSDDHPVVKVTWEESSEYCRWAGGRLPTEAEWEYAARGGRPSSIYPLGDSMNHYLANYGSEECCEGLAEGRDKWVYTAPVGSFDPNGYGLYDMVGNVWEWCSDWYGDEYYQTSPERDPSGPPTGTGHVRRGGGWGQFASWLRLSDRYETIPSGRVDQLGFRCARDEPH